MKKTALILLQTIFTNIKWTIHMLYRWARAHFS